MCGSFVRTIDQDLVHDLQLGSFAVECGTLQSGHTEHTLGTGQGNGDLHAVQSLGGVDDYGVAFDALDEDLFTDLGVHIFGSDQVNNITLSIKLQAKDIQDVHAVDELLVGDRNFFLFAVDCETHVVHAVGCSLTDGQSGLGIDHQFTIDVPVKIGHDFFRCRRLNFLLVKQTAQENEAQNTAGNSKHSNDCDQDPQPS